MKKSRIVGFLLCLVSAVVGVLHLFFGYIKPEQPKISLAFALPVTIILFVALALGFWLGWIMLTTKEAESAPTPPTEDTTEDTSEEEGDDSDEDSEEGEE